MSDSSFFEEQEPQSEVKAAIVSKYFKAWANVVLGTAKAMGVNLAYIDLFAGPGRYADEQKSTPILILEMALEHPELCKRLVTFFNDLDPKNTKSLEEAIAKIPNIEKLKFKPQ